MGYQCSIRMILESVTVLKACCFFGYLRGARKAAFGVILITTQRKDRLQPGFPLIILTISSISRPPMCLVKPHRFKDSVQAYKDMGTINYRGTEWGYVAGFIERIQCQSLRLIPIGMQCWTDCAIVCQNNLFDDMMETGFQQTHNLSVGGGTKISYRFSFGMVDENGVLASDKGCV